MNTKAAQHYVVPLNLLCCVFVPFQTFSDFFEKVKNSNRFLILPMYYVGVNKREEHTKHNLSGYK